MTAKEFLQRVFKEYQEVDTKIEQVARLQSLATRTTAIVRGTPCGNKQALSSCVEDAVSAIQEQANGLAAEIKYFLAVRQEVAAAIAQVKNPAERRVLEFRYLAFLSWKEISYAMKIGLSTVFRFHQQALNSFAADSKWE